MLLGYDVIGYKDGSCINTQICSPVYKKVELSNCIIDAFLARSDITKNFHTDKNYDWDIDTLLNAHFQGDLEAGNVSTMGRYIESILIQKREIDSLVWEDVVEFEYDEKIQYKILDKYIQNGFEYQYAMIPKSQNVVGNKKLSNIEKACFYGNFLIDDVSNYHFEYDIENSDIVNNVSQASFETINSRFPITVYGELDYKSGSMTALFYTGAIAEIDIKKQKQAKDNLFAFLKNKKPKIFKKEDGEMIIVNITGTPQEQPHSVQGLFKVKFDFVECAEFNKDNLLMYGLTQKGVGYSDKSTI